MRYEKKFTVRAAEDGSLEVFHMEEILYRLRGNWRHQLQEWRNTGWEIIWTA